MPESAGEKTEQPSSHRLSKAREQGNIPNSKEVPSAMMIAGLLGCLAFAGPELYEWFVVQVRQGMSLSYDVPLDSQSITALFRGKAMELAGVAMPFVVTGVCISVASSLISSGWSVSPSSAKPDLNKVNPIKGIKQMFSLQTLVTLLTSILKLAVVGYLAWTFLKNEKQTFMALRYATAAELISETCRLILGLMIRVIIALVAIAAGDLIYQRWNYKRKLKMTKHEVKEENKQHEGSPEVKGKRRGMQMAMARKRMLADVETADVVVTNPTHYAVALKYDTDESDAPLVVAKGADLVCQRIKELARDKRVPIVERPHLARTLYATTEVGQSIPQHLFVAVAEILAMIYRMRRARGGQPPVSRRTHNRKPRNSRS
jgi:flagellar biosynthesis protein FlhB